MFNSFCCVEVILMMADGVDFSHEVDPTVVGMSREGVRRAAAVFERYFAEGLNIGGQFVVLRDGEVVLDRVIGVKRLGTTQAVLPTTPFLLFSCTKPVTAVCVHQLIEQGLLELDAPVAEYWPEFACNGKGKVTVAQALLHQAGVPERGLYQQIPSWRNWDYVAQNVANLTAEWEPGSKTAYHLVNNGFILGELVRQVTGARIDEYMEEEIFSPLGMNNSYLGLPLEKLPDAAELYWEAADQRGTVLLFRSARHWVLPAATMNAPARDLAIFYQMLVIGGIYKGHRGLREELVREAVKLRTAGYDETLKDTIHWGYGFGVGGREAVEEGTHGSSFGRYSTFNTFGHGGQRSSVGWADRGERLVMTFTSNQMLDDAAALERIQDLADGVWEALVDHGNPKLLGMANG